MIIAEKNWDRLWKATEETREMCSLEDLTEWMRRPNNVMLYEDDNVGLASYQSPHVYLVHWYFPSARGRRAIDLAKAMCQKMFDDYGAITLGGLIKTNLKASKWAARQVGFKSYGEITFADGDVNEILFLTKGMNNG